MSSRPAGKKKGESGVDLLAASNNEEARQHVISGSHQPDEWTWHTRAHCRGAPADLFFPSPEEDPSAAKQVCAGCPVRVACLAFAIEHRERYGIWGGLTERERARLPEAERERISAAAKKVAREQPAA